MKNKKAIQETTSNYEYRRLMTVNTRCGWCGMGSGCNKTNRRDSYFYEEYISRSGVQKVRSHYPSWKIMSKYPKQYQKPRLKQKYHKILEKYFEFYW